MTEKNLSRLPRLSDDTAASFIRALPKTELHIHAEAVLGPATYSFLRRKYRGILSGELPENYLDLSRKAPLCDMVRRFFLLQSLLRASEDYALLAKDLKRYAKSGNLTYMEAFVSPSLALRSGILDFAAIMDPLLENSGPDIAFVVDVSRSFGAENAAVNLAATLKYIASRGGSGIVGIGLGGREAGNPPSAYRRTFMEAKEARLNRVAHAGEECGPESIRETLAALEVQRIGHGTSAIRDADLMTLLREGNIALEVCPTSNVYTGAFVGRYEDHPLPDFLNQGIRVTVNTDDPALFGVDLNEELTRVSARLGFGRAEIARVLLYAIDASFMPEERKTAERARLALVAGGWKETVARSGIPG
jgi:adenosine deaminase